MFGLAWRAWGRDNSDLVDRLKENEVLRSPRVEFAFRLVDRARFVPQLESATPTATHRHTQADTSMRDHQAYIDGPLKVGMVHISAPHMYAVVLEKLQLESGMRFLNVGSGSGYLSCMGSILVGRGGASHGVERLEEVVTHARTCAHNWRRYVDQLRRAQRQEAKEKEKISTPRDGAQPDKMDVEMKTCEEPMAGIGATTTADAFSRMSSGRSSPFVEDEEMSDATQHDVASSSSTGSSVPLSSLLPRPFAAINLVPPNGGVSRRGILGPAADVIQLSPSPMEGDTEVTTALTRSVVQMKTVAERLMVPSPSPPIGQEEEQENKTRAQDEKAPTPKVNEPIPKVNEPQFLVGDAFDLDPSVCGLYDRIYVGAGCEDRSIPFFASLLHPRGRLVGPFGSSMKVITKRGDGELTIEPISNVAYASIVYPEENPSAGETKEPIRFQSNVFSPPYGYSCLPPAMQSSIDALLMLQRRSGAESLFGRLPMVLLMHIMSYLPSEDYLNRRTGDVTWAVPVRANIARAREKHARASELTGDSSRAALESLLVDAVALVDHARDWLEIRLPTITDQHDSAEEDLSPGGAITVAGVETEISALTRIRDQPDTIETATFNDAINQVVQLYWTIHCGIRVCRRLLGLRPLDGTLWHTLASAYAHDHLLTDAIDACRQALRVVNGAPQAQSGDVAALRSRITELQSSLDSRMPGFRRAQQRVSDRLMEMLIHGLVGHELEADEREEDEEEEDEVPEEEEEEEEEEESALDADLT